MSKWEKIRLEEACILNMGQSPDSTSYNEEGEGLPFYQGNADFGDLHPQARYYCTKPTKIAHKNDVLISVRAPIGAVNIATEECCIGRGLAALTPLHHLDYKYLYYVIKNKNVELNLKGTGSTFTAINRKSLAETMINFPPLEEQKRIADILDKASNLIDLRKQQLEKMDLLIKSKFIDMFGDPVTNPKGWEVKQLADFADIIMGQSPSGEAYNENGIGMPLLNGPTEFGEKYPSEKQWTSITTKTCHKGDILFCVRGATAGRMNFADKEYCIGRGLAAIRGNKKKFNEFIYVVLKNMYEIFQNTSNGSTFININKEQLASVPIFVTTDKLQDQYLHFVEQVEKQKAVMQQSLEKMETNYKALMQEYFG